MRPAVRSGPAGLSAGLRPNGGLLNGRVNNLVYGSYAPGAPDIFLDDSGFERLWTGSERCYLVADGIALPRLVKRVGKDRLHVVVASGGKFLFSNR